MVEETRKSITKELDVCHDCAEYGLVSDPELAKTQAMVANW